MKCIPINLSGRLVKAASRVMEIEEVLDAMITSVGINLVELDQDLFFDVEALKNRLDNKIRFLTVL